MSELMEPASLLIDEASDLADDGKLKEAVEKYREALTALDTIERENPERVKAPEFASLRNKRAYVNAAIDSLLLSQVQQNARAVAVSDTTELEKRLEEEKQSKTSSSKPESKVESPKSSPKSNVQSPKTSPESKVQSPESSPPSPPPPPPAAPARPLTKREQAMADIAKGDFVAADLVIREMLAEKPNGAAALNLRAVMEIAQGKLKDAERTLDQAIMSNPRNYFAFYNMARLLLKIDASDRAAAARYYETGRTVGGPVDEELEKLLK